MNRLLYFWHWKICFWNTIILRRKIRKFIKDTLEESMSQTLEKAMGGDIYDLKRLWELK